MSNTQRAEYLLSVIRHASRKTSRFMFTNTRGLRSTVRGRIVQVTATVRGLSFKLDNGKTAVVRCNRDVVCMVFGLA